MTKKNIRYIYIRYKGRVIFKAILFKAVHSLRTWFYENGLLDFQENLTSY